MGRKFPYAAPHGSLVNERLALMSSKSRSRVRMRFSSEDCARSAEMT